MNEAYPRHSSLERFAGEVFKLVSRGPTDDQWTEWLEFPLEHALADGNAYIPRRRADRSWGDQGIEGASRRYLEGCDVLFKAAGSGCEELVNDMLAAGASPNARCGKINRTPSCGRIWIQRGGVDSIGRGGAQRRVG